jgi:hypothetical protein
MPQRQGSAPARRALAVGLGAALALAFLAACGSSKQTANGGECFVAADCQEPLVCVEQKDKTRRCTDDLDSVVGTLPPEAGARDAGQDARPNDAGPGGQREAGAEDRDTGAPAEPADTGTTDQ